MKVIVEADGGSRGNPGPAGYGTVVWSADHGAVLAESKQAIGRATNNVAEYRGLIAGLEEAAKLGATEVDVLMDSKLVVEQMSGRWKVKHPDLAVAASTGHGAVDALRPHHLRVDPAGRRTATPTGWPTRRWTPPPKSRLPQGRRDQSQTPSSSRGLDRCPRRPDPVPVAAPRADRVVHAAAVFRPRQPGADRRRAGARPRPPHSILAQKGGITAVITSPLQRAYDTAATAAKALGLDVTVDDDLIETDFGAWEGLTFDEAAERDPELHRRWLRDTSVKPPDGESFDSVAERVRRAQARIIAEHQGENVLVVSHVTPIKTLLRMALDAGPGLLYRLHLDLASLSIAEFYPDGVASVRLVNQTAYL